MSHRLGADAINPLGSVWGAIRSRPYRVLVLNHFETMILEVLPSYFEALHALEITPPIALMISLQGVRGAIPGTPHADQEHDRETPMARDELLLPEVTIENYGNPDEYHRQVQP